jgi:hypothetical protein
MKHVSFFNYSVYLCRNELFCYFHCWFQTGQFCVIEIQVLDFTGQEIQWPGDCVTVQWQRDGIVLWGVAVCSRVVVHRRFVESITHIVWHWIVLFTVITSSLRTVHLCPLLRCLICVTIGTTFITVFTIRWQYCPYSFTHLPLSGLLYEVKRRTPCVETIAVIRLWPSCKRLNRVSDLCEIPYGSSLQKFVEQAWVSAKSARWQSWFLNAWMGSYPSFPSFARVTAICRNLHNSLNLGSALLDSWVANKPSVKILYLKKIAELTGKGLAV